MFDCVSIIDETQIEVIISEDSVTLITIGEQGPTGAVGPAGPQGPIGPQGPAGQSSDTISGYTSSAALSGHRMVALDNSQQLVYASNLDLSQAERILGMTLGATNPGDSVTVIRSGEVTEPSWNWTLGQPIFLNQSGLLTQTPPASGFLIHVAFPITSTRVFVDIKQALIL